MAEYKRLDEVCAINMGQSPDSKSYNENGDGLPFFQGNADFGEMYPSVRMWCNAPTKVVDPGALLISVRAPIGALNFAAEKSCIGRGLAGITPKETVDIKYIYYCLKGKHAELNAKGTGSTFKAIAKNALGETAVRIIPLSEQKTVVESIDKVSSIIATRRQQLSSLDALVKARFVEMFGDPVTNPKKWGTVPLTELGELNRGISKHRPRNAPELLGGNYPLIQTGEIAAADLYVRGYSATYSEIGFKQSKMWPKGTLCITIAANIAKTAILDIDACFPDSIVGFITGERTNVLFIHFWFSFFQKLLEEQAPESAQKNISLQTLKELDVIIPPLGLQTRFADFVQQADKSKLLEQKYIYVIRHSLVQYKFGGNRYDTKSNEFQAE